ncbi:MAG: response regulator [Bacteriovoracia bacterium]
MDNLRIITVDDDPEFNIILNTVFKRAGLRAIITESAEEFLKQLKQNPPDLCIIDINLEKGFGAGFPLIKAIKNKYGDKVKIFIMSRRSKSEDISYALELGALDYLTKPLDEMILLTKIKHYFKDAKIEDELSYFTVPQSLSDCQFDVDLKLYKISEFGIVLKGRNYISKGTMVNLGNTKIFRDIFGKNHHKFLISHSEIAQNTEDVYSYIDFDQDDSQLMDAVRKWLINNDQKAT